MDSMAGKKSTKILLSKNSKRAIGVTYIEGVGLYGADNRYDPSYIPKTRKVLARKEIIVARGTFNSPQLLHLSGIGDCKHLESIGIECLVDLRRVGMNLQDNYKLLVLGVAQMDILKTSECTRGAPGDPCLEQWISDKTGPYVDAGLNSNY